MCGSHTRSFAIASGSTSSLFLLTVVTTTVVGADHYASFLSDFVNRDLPMPVRDLIIRGF